MGLPPAAAARYSCPMVRPPVERRSPERQPHTLQLLRTVAALALLATVVLLATPRLLAYLGLIGPTAAERIAEAEQAIETARSYGARPESSALSSARAEVETARRLAREGHDRAARLAARRAVRHANAAQAEALVGASEAQRRSAEVVQGLDRQVNELEDLYQKVSPGLGRATSSALLDRMRQARRTAAAVFLAHDEKRFAEALAQEAAARRVLAETRAALESAPRSSPPASR